jgi:hypothetical protein
MMKSWAMVLEISKTVLYKKWIITVADRAMGAMKIDDLSPLPSLRLSVRQVLST